MTTESQPIRIATRKSALALYQAEQVRAHLATTCVDAIPELLPMSTKGDEQLNWSLEKKGGKGLFTSELERALLACEADLAVHSAKDLPTELPNGLALAGYLPRAAVEDVLVIRDACAQPRLVATGSPRRRGQLKRFFPGVEWTEIRGNVETRLRKIREGEADATVMALAGLKRLNLWQSEGLRFIPLSIHQSVPAAGQGAIALQCRVDEVSRWAAGLCEATRLAVDIERRALAAMGGGCHSAAAAHYCNGRLWLFEERRGNRVLPLADAELSTDWESVIRDWLL